MRTHILEVDGSRKRENKTEEKRRKKTHRERKRSESTTTAKHIEQFILLLCTLQLVHHEYLYRKQSTPCEHWCARR